MTRPVARVFVPAPLQPDFPDGFSARWYHLIRALAESFDIEIVAVRGIWHGSQVADDAFRADLPHRSFQLFDYAPSRSLIDRVGEGMAKVLARSDLRCELPRIPGIESALGAPPALAVFFLHFLAPLHLAFPQRTHCVFVLEENIVAMHGRNRASGEPWPLRITNTALSSWRNYRYARLATACGDRGRVVVISDEEKISFARLIPANRISVVPNGLDPGLYQPRPPVPDHDVGIFGNLSEPRNYEPTRQLLELAQQRNSKLRWLLVGANPHPSLSELANSRVTITGMVPDPAEFYPRVRVVVVPARVTAGSKSTLLKAWALQRPVVTTPESARGLPARHGENVIVASDTAGLVDAAAALALDPARSSNLAASGRRTLLEQCDIRAHAATFAQICRDAVDSS